jgi:DNA segregation ATPase FtsK/SpoIIIE, S-DNA-T family
MRQSVRANDPDPADGATTPETEEVRLGFEGQAEGLALLRSGLDVYIDRMKTANTRRDEILASAVNARDRVLQKSDTVLSETLEEIELRAQQASKELANKRDAAIQAAQKDRSKLESSARSEHNHRSAKAKKAKEETAWLADTVLESAMRKAKSEHQESERSIEKQLKNLDKLEESLAIELGPTIASKLTNINPTVPVSPESATFEGLEAAIQAASDAFLPLDVGGIRKLLRGRTKGLALGAEMRDLIIQARCYAESLTAVTALQYENRVAEIRAKHNKEVDHADHALRVASKSSERKAGSAVREAYEAFETKSKEIESRRDRDAQEIEQWRSKQLQAAQEKHDSTIQSAINAYTELTENAAEHHTQTHKNARAELVQAATPALGLVRLTDEQARASNPSWSKVASIEQPKNVPEVIEIAIANLDLKERVEQIEQDLIDELRIPELLETAIVLNLPGACSFLVRHDESSRTQALSTMRTVMLRILASFPAGKVRFLMADPIGIGQSFAGFMPLSDQEPSPVGLRIWTDPQQIERQLADITEHMQTVIQKYLRADFETIEDYNHAAGEISEPYRFVILADLPASLTDAGAARLKSILESGPRCGVYALLSTGVGEKLPSTLTAETLESTTIELLIEDGIPQFKDDRFDELELSLIPEPDDELTARVLDRVASAGAQAGRVEVPFDRLAPNPDELWTRSCDDELVIPVGRSGAQKNQELRLGSGTRQHALIAGRTGSGKSTLLHVIISAATLWHSPDELEIYLIDFKKGVEFKAYTGGRVPHVRAVAIESDREFGLSVLKRLDDELTTRGDLFRQLGAQDLASARKMAPDERLPRVLLLIDEFQEFFTEDDGVASEATLLLDRLVRQGRAFGVHVVLGSQTLSGAYSLARSTLGQIGVRIALQCSEADSYMILGEDNNAARLLERPGEAIYNNAGGLVEGNSPFQTAWLSDAERDTFLDQMPMPTTPIAEPVVFEGNRPAQFDTSTEAFVRAFPDRKIPRALLGDAVAIAPPTSVALKKRSGSNLLIIGPQPEPALGMLVSSAITAGSSPGAQVIVVDPTPEDDALFGRIPAAISVHGLNARIVTHREADSIVAEINAVIQERNEHSGDPILLVLAGIHRLRSLRKSDDYSFSLDEETASPDKDLMNILREGPAVGVWTLAWCDTLTNIERAMDRSTIREFGLRALMQMSASDSAAMVDSSIASTLGANRAILADDVEGTIQKFRPIDLPEASVAQRAAKYLFL